MQRAGADTQRAPRAVANIGWLLGFLSPYVRVFWQGRRRTGGVGRRRAMCAHDHHRQAMAVERISPISIGRRSRPWLAFLTKPSTSRGYGPLAA